MDKPMPRQPDNRGSSPVERETKSPDGVKVAPLPEGIGDIAVKKETKPEEPQKEIKPELVKPPEPVQPPKTEITENDGSTGEPLTFVKTELPPDKQIDEFLDDDPKNIKTASRMAEAVAHLQGTDQEPKN